MLSLTTIELANLPAPYAWNAVSAYAADLGWGLLENLTPAQYSAGNNLFWYSTALKNVPFFQGGPIVLSEWMELPPGLPQIV